MPIKSNINQLTRKDNIMNNINNIDLVFRLKDGNDVQVGIFNDGDDGDGVNVTYYADLSNESDRESVRGYIESIRRAVENHKDIN